MTKEVKKEKKEKKKNKEQTLEVQSGRVGGKGSIGGRK